MNINKKSEFSKSYRNEIKQKWTVVTLEGKRDAVSPRK